MESSVGPDRANRRVAGGRCGSYLPFSGHSTRRRGG
jgi:hypothetical protein